MLFVIGETDIQEEAEDESKPVEELGDAAEDLVEVKETNQEAIEETIEENDEEIEEVTEEAGEEEEDVEDEVCFVCFKVCMKQFVHICLEKSSSTF